MKENPFTLMFGKVSSSIVPRQEMIDGILEEFTKTVPQNPAWLITGIRGCGKTVVLREAARRLEERGWIVIDLNPQGDLLRSFAQGLYEQGRKHKLFLDWTLTFSVPYFTLSIKKQTMSDDPEAIARRLTSGALERGKRIAITIDEVAVTDSLRYFANFFQSIMGAGIPLCLLMTGIRENVEAISSDRSMSFLSRLPKIHLGPLDLGEEALEYAKALNVSLPLATKLARLTKGYAFAYQVLGHFFFEQNKQDIDDALTQTFSTYLWRNGYDVLWRGLTKGDKRFLIALAESPSADSRDVMARAKMSESNYQNYRRRLLERGLIRGENYGKISFALPAFDGYALFMKSFE